MIRCTLLGDGSSDRMLLAPLRWLLEDLYPGVQTTLRFADLRQRSRSSRTLPQRIRETLLVYPCDLLFIHRDAETDSIQKRVQEIEDALREVSEVIPASVAVVPVPMTEAWFLHDERAIRLAANNPNGKQPLPLPSPGVVPGIADPKALLVDLLVRACGLKDRRLRNFRPRMQMHQLADVIEDFSPLRQQESFRHLEDQLRALADSPLMAHRRNIG